MNRVYKATTAGKVTKRIQIAVVLIALALLLWWKQPVVLMRPMATFGNTLLAPVENLFSLSAFWFHDTYKTVASISTLKQENEELKKQTITLEAEKVRLDTLAAENEELRRNLKLLPKEKYDLVTAEVVARNVSESSAGFVINRGTQDGIEVGDVVVVEAGVLVGRVSEAFASSSVVTQITSGESVINAEVLNTKTRGVARGEHGINVVLDMVEQGQAISDGDTIVTSGLAGEVPQGLLIGTVRNLRPSEDRLFQKGNIQSPVDLSRLRFVAILKKI